MKYFLSNNQLTALKVRGEALQIALPIPVHFPADPTTAQMTEFFLSYLGGIEPAWLRKIEETEITITPLGGKFDELAMPLIIPESEWHITTPVIVGTICEKPQPRNGTRPIQRPGDLRHIATLPPDKEITYETEHGTWTATVADRKLTVKTPTGETLAVCNTGKDSLILQILTLAAQCAKSARAEPAHAPRKSTAKR